MRKGYKQLIAEADAIVETIQADEAVKQFQTEEVVFIDIRERVELERDGRIPGAVHASRGMLEFLADPESPYHMDVFASGKKLILFCAYGERSALAAQRLQEMGINHVARIGGGMKAWKAANGPVDFPHLSQPILKSSESKRHTR